MVKYDIEAMSVDYDTLNNAIAGSCESLFGAFLWDETPEGLDYWSSQSSSRRPLDLETLEEIRRQYCEYTQDSIDTSTLGDAQKEFDPVDKPAHYNQGGIECIDYIRQTLGEEGFKAYCLGNTIKYVHRHPYKGKALEDLKKARYYLDKAVSVLEEADP